MGRKKKSKNYIYLIVLGLIALMVFIGYSSVQASYTYSFVGGNIESSWEESEGGGDTLGDGLIAFYELKDDADDSWGSNDATAYGGVTFTGASAVFDGVDDYIDTPIGATTNDYQTVSFQFRGDTYTGRLGGTYWYGSATRNYNCDVSTIAYGRWSGTTLSYSGSLLDNQWHNAVFIEDTTNNVAQMWIDGVLRASSSSRTYPDGEFFIGSQSGLYQGGDTQGSATAFYTGEIRNVALWDRGLTAEEVPLVNNFALSSSYILSVSDGFTTQTTEFEEGTEVNLSAISNEDFVFNSWSGGIVSEEQNITIIMDSDVSITANFDVDETIVYVSSGTRKVRYHEFEEEVEDVVEIQIIDNVIQPEISAYSEMSSSITGFFTNLWNKFWGLF